MRAQEKIKVFISSSMSTNEDGHDWLIFRKELADQIDNSSILTPFRIEEYGSLIPSEQYYLTKIEQTDIVVALVYGELRPGTENEIRYAIELNKPVLFLKVGDKENQSIRDIVSFLHIKDYCTTVAVDSFTDLTQEVVDYIEDTIVTLFHGRLFEITKKRVSGVGVSRLGEVAIPTDVIDSFGLSQIRLLERIGYYLDWLEPKSADPCLEALGNAIVDWAVDGEPLDLSQYKELMFSAMRESGCHKQILRAKTEKLFRDGHYARAVEEAYKYIDNLVKRRVRKLCNATSGASLMRTALSPKKPILMLNDNSTEIDIDEQQGYMDIFAGCMTGIRNPRAHDTDLEDERENALKLLSWADHLVFMVKNAKVVSG